MPAYLFKRSRSIFPQTAVHEKIRRAVVHAAGDMPFYSGLEKLCPLARQMLLDRCDLQTREKLQNFFDGKAECDGWLIIELLLLV